MSIVEFIGFLISFLAFIYLMFNRVIDEWLRGGKKRETSEDGESLEDFLKSLEGDMRVLDGKAPPPPPLKPKAVIREVKKKKDLPPVQSSTSSFDSREERTPSIMSDYFEKLSKGDAYEVLGKRKRSYGRALLASLHSKKEMVILSEIINRPKGFRF